MRRLEVHACSKCGETNLNKFSKNKVKASGLQGTCKECIKEHKNNVKYEFNVVLGRIYSGHLSSSRKRGHDAPTYNLEEFKVWAIENGYIDIYNNFRDSGYNKILRPSCDRIDERFGYKFSNMTMMTWGDNFNKEKYRQQKRVNQYDLEGNFIKTFESVKSTGVNNVSKVCSGQYKQAGGFVWKYED